MITKLAIKFLEAVHLRMPSVQSGQELVFGLSAKKGFSKSRVDNCAFNYANLTGTPFSGTEITKSDFTGAYVVALDPKTQRQIMVTGPFLKQYLVDVCGAKIDQETAF